MNYRLTTSNLAGILFVCVSFFSCKKDLKDSVTSSSAKAGPIPSYQFQWDQATYMPSSPANTIPMPWNSGTTQIEPDFVDDYKQVDGWELVYNTFTPTTPTTGSAMPYFFTLYNKYRAQLRFYVWQPPTPIPSTYIKHDISIYSSAATQSSMLNFASNDLVDMNNNALQATNITQQQLAANGGTWVAYQYEIAYDPSITASSFPNLGLGVDAQFVNVSQIKLEGTQVGDISGTLGSSGSSGFPLTGIATNVAKGSFVVPGVAAMNKVMSDAKNKENPFLKIVSGSLTSLLTGNVTGVLSAVISGIFGGSGSSAQKVSLTMNSKIDLTGTIISNGGLLNIKLPLPGQSNSQTTDGLTPLYNNTLGIFNLSSQPVIKCVRKNVSAGAQNPAYISYSNFSIDPSSYNFLANPALSGIANIQNIRTELLYMLTEGEGSNVIMGRLRTLPSKIGNLTVYMGFPSMTINGTQQNLPLPGKVAIRISADVVPSNGAPTTTIVKTFLSTLVYN